MKQLNIREGDPEIIENQFLTDISPIRIETVLSRYPIHNLSKKEQINIHIHKRNEVGETHVLWKVSYSGLVPRQLAYKLDSLIVNKVVDEVTRPLTRKGERRAVPEFLALGSINHICHELGIQSSGNMRRQIRQAFEANIGTTIKAQITYKGNDGGEKSLKATFSRYAIVERGEKLPNSETADCTYVVFNPVYREVLNNAPLMPLDWEYMKKLSPRTQRFYEIMSVRMLVAVRYKHKETRITYSEFCMLSAQPRMRTLEAAHAQMSKIHRPHVQNGYITSASFSAIESLDDLPDWEISYIPGPKAEAEYRKFNSESLLDSSVMTAKAIGSAKTTLKKSRSGSQPKLPSMFEEWEGKPSLSS